MSSWDFFVDLCHVFKAFVGTNYLSMPFAFRNGGLLAAAVGLIAISALTCYCMLLLIRCRQHLEQSTGTVGMSFGELAQHVLGPFGRSLVEGIVALTQFGFCIGYVIFLSSTLSSISSLSVQTCMVLLAIPLIPLCLVRDLAQLAPFSLVADIALLTGSLSVAYFSYSSLVQPGHVLDVDLVAPDTFPVFFGMTVGAIEGIGLVLPLEDANRTGRARFPRVLNSVMIGMTVFLLFHGAMGYLAFGAQIHDIIIFNLAASPAITALKLGLCLSVLFTYPIQMFPVSIIVDGVLLPTSARGPASAHTALKHVPGGDGQRSSTDEVCKPAAALVSRTPRLPSEVVPLLATSADSLLAEEGYSPPATVARTPKKDSLTRSASLAELQSEASRHGTLVRVMLVLSSIACAVAVPSFAVVVNFIGSVGSTPLSFLLPAICHYKLFSRRSGGKELAIDAALMVFGVVATVMGTWRSTADVISVWSRP